MGAVHALKQYMVVCAKVVLCVLPPLVLLCMGLLHSWEMHVESFHEGDGTPMES